MVASYPYHRAARGAPAGSPPLTDDGLRRRRLRRNLVLAAVIAAAAALVVLGGSTRCHRRRRGRCSPGEGRIRVVDEEQPKGDHAQSEHTSPPLPGVHACE